MRCYYTIGQRNKALQQFKKCVGVLEEELEVRPTTSTIELYKQMTGKTFHFDKQQEKKGGHGKLVDEHYPKADSAWIVGLPIKKL